MVPSKPLNYICSHQHGRILYDYACVGGQFYYLPDESPEPFVFFGIKPEHYTPYNGTLVDKTVIYTNICDYLKTLESVSKLKTRHVILVDTGEGMLQNWNVPSNVLEVFCPHVKDVNDIYKPFPRGTLKDIANVMEYVVGTIPAIRIGLCYARFPAIHYGERVKLHAKFRTPEYDWIKKDNYTTGSHDTLVDYFCNLLRHQTVICPKGNATSWQSSKANETYREWEAHYCGCYPIVVRCHQTEYFSQFLPIIQLDSWDKLSEGLVRDEVERCKLRKSEGLSERWWANFIRRRFND